MNKKITILTPSFNRVNLLGRLYNSLLEQTYKDFIWMVIDDGSTDETEIVIQNFIHENKIEIQYLKKENGGKHTAINLGVKNCKTPLILFLDSDDILTKDAVKITLDYFEKIEDNDKICGITGLSRYIHNQEIVGTEFPENDWAVPFADLYLKYAVKGDKSVAFKTDVLKQFPFPENDDVKFVFEAVVWHEMSKKYDVIAHNKTIQLVEYQEKGLSDSSYKKSYTKGLAFSYFQLIKNKTYSFRKYPKEFIWNYVHLIINSLLSNKSYFKELSFTDKMIYLVVFSRAYYTFVKLKDKMIND